MTPSPGDGAERVDERRRYGVYAGLVVMAACWGGAFVAGRIAATEVPPAMAALLRFVVASAALLVVAFALERGLPRLTVRQGIAVVLMGVTGVVIFNLCFMYGLARAPASRGALIMALNPALTLLGAIVFLGEAVTRDKVLGIVIALAGVVVVLGHGNPANLLRGSVGPGDLLLFGCPLSWAAYSLIGKHALPGLSAVAVTTYAALVGTVLLAVVTVAVGDLAWPSASWQAWTAIGFVGLFGTALAFLLFYRGVRAIGPARTSVFINLVPVVAVLLGVLLLGETPEASMLAGGVLVVAGVLLLNRTPPPRAVVAPQGT